MVFYGLDELDVFEDGRFAGCETGSGDAAGSFGGAWARHVHATCSRDNREDDRYGMHECLWGRENGREYVNTTSCTISQNGNMHELRCIYSPPPS